MPQIPLDSHNLCGPQMRQKDILLRHFRSRCGTSNAPNIKCATLAAKICQQAVLYAQPEKPSSISLDSLILFGILLYTTKCRLSSAIIITHQQVL